MLRTLSTTLLFPLLVTSSLAAGFDNLPDKAEIVPKDFSDLGYKPLLGEIWGVAGAAPEEPQYCLINDKVVCVTYAFNKVRMLENSSWHNFYGLEGLPPVDHMLMLFEPGKAEVPDRFRLVLFFAKAEDMQPWVN